MNEEFKNRQVAVITDINGKCKYVGKVRFVNEMEYNKLVNESNLIDAEKLARKKQLQYEILKLKQEIARIDKEIKLLKGEE